MPYEQIGIREIDNPVKLIADGWALLSAGAPGDWNTMTVSWGGVGELWGFDAAFIFVRPQRYTLKYLDANECFTLSFGLPRETMALCGKISGRDCDKIARAGLTAHQEVTPSGECEAVWPEGAKLAVVCRKAAKQAIDPAGFIDPRIEGNYKGDYHQMFVGEIVGVYRAAAG
ncbi:MAG: flavin reductase [Firmicutes bacterium]|nr:flavin reductase [Bacillota bacterium]